MYITLLQHSRSWNARKLDTLAPPTLTECGNLLRHVHVSTGDEHIHGT